MEPVSEWIRWRFPAVRSLGPAALELRQRGERERLLLLDVRSAAEYEVSHLEGAVRIDPDTSDVETVVKELGLTGSAGTVVICYCTVGFHACRMAQRLGDFLAGDSAQSDPGTVDVYNLEGGLLRWDREKRPLVDGSNQPSSHLHPYCQLWEELLEADFKPPA